MRKRSGLYPRVHVDTAGSGGVAGRWGAAGGDGPGQRPGLGPDRGTRAVAEADRDPRPSEDHAGSRGQPGPRWDCLADVAVLRAEPGVYGRVTSDPTVSRLVDALAADARRALAAINTARAAAAARGNGR